MAGDKERHHFVADLRVVERLSRVRIARGQQHRERVPPIFAAAAPLGDQSQHDFVQHRSGAAETLHRPERQPARDCTERSEHVGKDRYDFMKGRRNAICLVARIDAEQRF